MDSGLYVVATPIGNLGDITYRAVEVLRSVAIIAAEDTRHTRRLLEHFDIATSVMAYHDHSDRRAGDRLVDCLSGGGSVALVSDAGTPLISDPGYRLVRRVRQLGYPVYPVPGPCAAVAALSVSGLPTDRFLFEGFLPARPGARAGRLAELAAVPVSLVFYEAPHRLLDCLRAMMDAFGPDREAVLARELTKAYETIRLASLAQLLDFVESDSNQSRGEIVLLVAGRGRVEGELDADTSALLLRLAEELPAKRAAAVVADLTGVRRKVLYNHLLEHRGA